MDKGYAFEHEGAVFTPDGKADLTPAGMADHNAQLEQAELRQWAERPDRAMAYFEFPGTPNDGRQYRHVFQPTTTGATVATWLGTVLGRITEARVYRHNFGQRFVSLRVLGSNGAEYWGRASWDGGNAVILRKVRSR